MTKFVLVSGRAGIGDLNGWFQNLYSEPPLQILRDEAKNQVVTRS